MLHVFLHVQQVTIIISFYILFDLPMIIDYKLAEKRRIMLTETG